MFNDKSILITGGTGSFGKRFVSRILIKYKKIKRLVIYSRDELKQLEMSNEINRKLYPFIRYFIGDVRDLDRLKFAMQEVDIVIHAAALKHVPMAEYNPFEAVKTNILGAQNVIDATIANDVKKVIALSTDKASSPINLYGATKLTSDKLFVAANNYKGSKKIKFSVVRYGNVMGSRGSVIPLFLKMKKNNIFPITDKKMTRFNITLEESVNFVLFCLNKMWGGEIFVPKIPSYKIIDFAKAISTKAKLKFVGIRAGEKLHEEMITDTDSLNTIDLGKYYAILPSVSFTCSEDDYLLHHKATKVPFGFRYNSGTNDEWETIDSLRDLIIEHVDANFEA